MALKSRPVGLRLELAAAARPAGRPRAIIESWHPIAVPRGHPAASPGHRGTQPGRCDPTGGGQDRPRAWHRAEQKIETKR
eukprot:660585-Hanusia_phi.AAC.1